LIADKREVKTLAMDASRQTAAIADIAAVLDWWREAGVDCAFDDAPRQWIVAADAAEEGVAPSVGVVPAEGARPEPAPPPPTIGGDRAAWPTDLAGFASWWLSEPSLDTGQLPDRVPPRGPAGAPLMVLVPEPEVGDSDTLLSGPQGRLLAAMLAAMGLSADEVYFASALPRHTPMADWATLAAQGLGEVLRLHVALARPQRLIAFGRHIPPLLAISGLGPPLNGNVPTQNSLILPTINQEGGSVTLLVARDLGSLLERPIAKGAFWQHWLEWSGG
jgi:DNA polymerase